MSNDARERKWSQTVVGASASWPRWFVVAAALGFLEWLVVALIGQIQGLPASRPSLTTFSGSAATLAALYPSQGAPLQMTGGAILEWMVGLTIEMALVAFALAALIGTVLDFVDDDLVPSVGRFLRAGWRLWSWAWRGLAFMAVAVAMGETIVQTLIIVLSVLSHLLGVGSVFSTTEQALSAAVEATFALLVIPLLITALLLGFANRPVGYWRALGSSWHELSRGRGHLLWPVWVLTLGTYAMVAAARVGGWTGPSQALASAVWGTALFIPISMIVLSRARHQNSLEATAGEGELGRPPATSDRTRLEESTGPRMRRPPLI